MSLAVMFKQELLKEAVMLCVKTESELTTPQAVMLAPAGPPAIEKPVMDGSKSRTRAAPKTITMTPTKMATAAKSPFLFFILF